MLTFADWNLFDPKRVKRIFTLGETRVGKSTLLASLAYTTMTTGEVVVVPHMDNIVGYKKFARDWIEAMRNQRFPAWTDPAEFCEVEFAIGSSQADLLPLCFYEASGEHVRGFDRLRDDYDGLKQHIVEAIEKSSLFFLVHPYEELNGGVSEYDVFFHQFVNTVMEVKGGRRAYEDVAFALVITKVESGFDAITYAKGAFPATAKLIGSYEESLPPKVFPFSVGEVEGTGEDAYIKNYDNTHTKQVINWINKIL